MAYLYKSLEPKVTYVDKKWRQSREAYFDRLSRSTTIYVGNLSFKTTEEQIWTLFSKVGEIKKIIMGLNRQKMTPCGFCFVEYFTRQAAQDCVNWINGTKLDQREIRTDFDFGFEEGRQYGRGVSGGQVRDEFRTDYDADRGGYGIQLALEMLEEEEQKRKQKEAGTGTAPDVEMKVDAHAEGSEDVSLKRKREAGSGDEEGTSPKRSRTY
eukprot:TRINITY_DN13295_c0_g1_i1.p1 TRINITY_DN13295_c0_g1~~TRINITY_DN13295_c0_g1_i1.p1  ORF type:complete len:219 (-),score=57.61 TRINITY_DN13295_c0_g1_i1:137-769(-)